MAVTDGVARAEVDVILLGLFRADLAGCRRRTCGSARSGRCSGALRIRGRHLQSNRQRKSQYREPEIALSIVPHVRPPRHQPSLRPEISDKSTTFTRLERAATDSRK